MRVLYFAQAAELAHCREELWNANSSLSQEAFWAELESKHPGMAALRPICRLACNREYLGPEAFLQPGDEVAIIPPVSGG